MSKIIATLAIVSLFVSLASCGTTSQSGIFTSSYLNSTASKVYGANATGSDLTIWQTIPYNQIVFGPASTNATNFVYGIMTSSAGVVTIYVRTVNATIVGYGNDTTETSYIASDATITSSAGSGAVSSLAYAVGPGYLGILAVGLDNSATPKSQVYLIIVSGGTTAVSKTLTTNAGTTTATYTISSSSLFYEPGVPAFFYAFAGSAYTSGSAAPYTVTINAGGYFASGNASYFAANFYTLTPGTAYTLAQVAQVSSPIIGGDNFTSASNIYVVYKDSSLATPTTYYSKTSKATTTTALGSATSLVADSAVSTNTTTYVPIGVWASNYTYGISTSLKVVVSSGTPTYSIANFYNGTATGYDSGLGTASYVATSVIGFELNTGYSLIGVVGTATSGTSALSYASFFYNATLNTTSNGLVTLSSGLAGPFNVFEDANGAEWVGWTDYTYTTANNVNSPTTTLYGYLAKLQGQLNPSSSTFANALKGIMAFVAFCLAAVFAF